VLIEVLICQFQHTGSLVHFLFKKVPVSLFIDPAGWKLGAIYLELFVDMNDHWPVIAATQLVAYLSVGNPVMSSVAMARSGVLVVLQGLE
jgi:hypothetical protein